MKKRILPFLMTLTMIAVNVPMLANASEASSDSENGQAVVAEEPEVVDDPVSDDTQDGDVAAEDDTVTDEEQEAMPISEETESEEIQDNHVESDTVVTLGENLSAEQRAAMYSYFGTSADEVRTIIVTHADEVKYMAGIATDAQIGNTTNSCAYVEPTTSGGIKVKTANLNFVTSAMIASTLTTAGMENCNVVAACPFEVSGTGALTGIIMAYETASGESLDEDKKEAAMEELITTGNLADTLGSEVATEVMNEVKTEILDKGLTDPAEIGDAVDGIAANHGVTLTEDQRQQVIDLMEKISQYDYDISSIKKTLDNLSGKVGALESAWNSIKSFFVGSGNGILSQTNDEALGLDIITDSTVAEGGFKDGLLTRILNLFK
ncbi:MAG: DUF1002 domain-containing protein [Eubacteriales bacterium]|nr:DUF1002 domain-containing protein [Eubacteriales bacterium]